MRKAVIAAAAIALAAAGAALAQPPGLHEMDGVKMDGKGMPLYTYDNDTMKGMSHCEGRCAEAWPPLVAAPDAKASGDWTLINRGGGVKQWAYKDKPVYTFARDKAHNPPTGGEIPNWKLLK